MHRTLLVRIAAVIFITFLAVVGIYIYRENKLTTDTRNFLEDVKKTVGVYVDISYGGVSANIFNDKITITKLKIAPSRYLPLKAELPPIEIEKITYKYKYDTQIKMLTYLYLDVTGFQDNFDAAFFQQLAARTQNPLFADMVSAMKDQNFLADIHCDYVYKPANQSMLIKIDENLRGLGRIGAGIILNGVTTGVGQYEMLENLELKQFRVQYNEENFVNLVLSQEAKKAGVDKKTIVKRMQGILDMVINTNKDPLQVAAFKEVKIFIEKPKQFIIDGSPNPSVSFNELKLLSSTDFMDRLNIKTQAN